MGNFIVEKFYLFFEGILLFQAIFFGMGYFILRRMDVLYYSLLNLATAAYFFLNAPDTFLGIEKDIVFNSSLYIYLNFAVLLSMILTYTLFLKEIFIDTLEQYAYVSKIYAVTVYAIPVVYFLFAVFTGMGWTTKLIFSTGNILNGPFIILILLLNYRKKGYKSLIINGVLVSFVCAITTMFFSIRSSEGNIDTILDKYPLAIIKIGMLIDIVLFQLALLNRWNTQEKQLVVEKLQSKLAEEKIRNKISRDLHDDLGSDLYKISLLSEMISPQMQEGKGKTDMEKITASAKDSLEKMGEIVWTMNASQNGLPSLIAYFRKFAVEYFELAGVECAVKLPATVPDRLIPGQIRRALLLSYKEALRNVVRHAEAKAVDISFSVTEEQLCICIHDNGKGMHIAGGHPFGNGLTNMLTRMEESGGSFAIENNNGTTVRLTIDSWLQRL